jgi:hypothetical protein
MFHYPASIAGPTSFYNFCASIRPLLTIFIYHPATVRVQATILVAEQSKYIFPSFTYHFLIICGVIEYIVPEFLNLNVYIRN